MSSIRSKSVLYVEDSPVNVFLVQAIFEPRGDVKLHTAVDGAAGLALARQHRPDLILLDMNLPDMDGAEFLIQLRGDESLTAIPVVIVSADTISELGKNCLELGAADFITKPFDLGEFEKLVDRFIGAGFH